MNRFWRYFIPFQLWRFAIINAKMYLIAKDRIGPHASPAAPVARRPTSSLAPRS